MVCLWNFVTSLFIFIPLLGLVNGFAIKHSKPTSLPSSDNTPKPTQQLPLDILSKAIVKREIDLDEDNGLTSYDTDSNMMYHMPKRTALGISKILLAPFYPSSPRSHNMYESQLESLNKEQNIQPSALYLNSNSFQDGIKREGQKDGRNRKYLKCFFNAVSCFRKK